MNETTLQERFIVSHGESILMDNEKVFQMDRILLSTALVTVQFLDFFKDGHGVILKASKKCIQLSNGEKTQSLKIWNDLSLSRMITHRIDFSCKGELRVWNIYKVRHSSGHVTEDAWTGNAGMVISEIGENYKIYKCSSGPGEFNPEEFSFRLSWQFLDE